MKGFSGTVEYLSIHDGDLYAAGSIILDADTTNLARLRGGQWEQVSGLDGSVVALKVEGGALYVGAQLTVYPEPIESIVYRVTGENVEPVTPRWGEKLNTFAVAGETIYLGGDGRFNRNRSMTSQPVPLARVVDGRIVPQSGARGFTGARDDEQPHFIQFRPSSIDALHWYDGWLYVAGKFDSVADFAVGSIARFNGKEWEALDKGVSRVRSYYWSDAECGPVALDKVSSIGVMNGSLIVAGKFRRVGTLDNSASPVGDGTVVSVPIALYDFTTKRWRPATPNLSEGISSDFTPNIRSMTVSNGRIAIVGDFTLPGSPVSRNVAVSGRTLSVEGEVPVLRLDLW